MYRNSFIQRLRRSLPLALVLAGLSLSGCSKDEIETPISKPGEDGTPVLTQAVNSSIPMLGASGALPPGEWYFCLKATQSEGDEPAKEFFIPGSAGEKKDGTYMHLLLPENTACMSYIVSYVVNADKSVYYELGFLIQIREDGSIACSTAYNEEADQFGAGTRENPYQISSLEDIIDISAANLDKVLTDIYFIQVEDINCNDGTSFNSDNGGIAPIGNPQFPFRGHYDGNGHTIKKLSLVPSGETNTATNLGLFGVIDGNATVRNLKMKDINIQAGRTNVGGIAGKMAGNSQIINCTVSGGSIAGIHATGGIVGLMQGGKIDSCSNKDCTVTVQTLNSPYTDCMGGIIGLVSPLKGAKVEIGTLTANANITGHENVGGIIGFISDESSALYTLSDLTTTKDGANIKSISGVRSVGGLIGGCTASLNIQKSAVLALINATAGDLRDFGGLIGAIGTSGTVTLKDCIVGANKFGEQPDASKKYIAGKMMNLGGFIGYVKADGGVKLSNCTIAANMQGERYVGGLIGQTVSPTTIEGCTNNKATIIATKALTSYAGGLVGYAIEKITFSGTNLNEGNVQATNACAGGFIGYGKDVAITGGIVTGNVSAGGYYAGGYVGYAESLKANDISIEKSDLTVGSTGRQGGLAGYIGSGEIKNVTLAFHVGIPDSKAESSGGLVGYLVNGLIDNCTFKGSVQGGRYTGGIAGHHDGGKISNCETTSDNSIVCNETGQVGGIVGAMTQVELLNCTNRTEVNNANRSSLNGGIVGYIGTQGSDKPIHNCLNYAPVTGGDQTGGIMGGTAPNNTSNNLLTHCHNHGAVTGQNETGGISGSFAQGQIIYCSNHGVIISNKSAGGISGCLYGNEGFHASGLINESYNVGQVYAKENVGGIVGKFYSWGYARVYHCYNRARVGYDDSRSCAGIVGYIDDNAYGNIRYCYSGGEERTGWGIFGRIRAETSAECNWILCHYSSESAESDGHKNPNYVRNTNGGLSDQSNFKDWNFNSMWIMKAQPELRNNRETKDL